jgi:uncharacterized protein (TIGR02466 family)
MTRPSQNRYAPARLEVLNVFPTPFARGILDIDLDQVVEDCRNLVAEVHERCPDNNGQNYTTYFDQDLREIMHEYEWFKEFSDRIKDTYIDFISRTFESRIEHLSRSDIHLFSWVNRYEGHHHHEIHNHVDSFISGTWYIKAAKTSPIKFLSPNLMATFSHKTEDRMIKREGFPNIEFNGVNGVDQEFCLFPLDGEFLMWPSYMQHTVPANYEPVDDKYERISLSFNLKHKEIITDNETGHDMSYGELNESKR